MENKNIIIILIVIIVILAAAIGVILLNQTAAKEPTQLKITSDKEQDEGGKLSVQLTDLNKTPISKEIVNITVTSSKGKVVVDDVVKTDSKGKAKLDLDLKKGKYNVTVSYSGNENYTDNVTTQKLTIKEKVTTEDNADKSHSSKYAPDGGIYAEYGPAVDNQGITREYAIANDMHYIEMTVDGDRPGEYVTVGGYTARDPNTGTYHT